jgi:hypothetical protein
MRGARAYVCVCRVRYLVHVGASNSKMRGYIHKLVHGRGGARGQGGVSRPYGGLLTPMPRLFVRRGCT